MKELKKLSLKEEIDREVEETEKKIEYRKDIDDLKVSDDMETSLFNKIQEYEFDKRMKKKVKRKKKKRYIVVALAAVLILTLGSVMTGVGSKSYWKVLWDRSEDDGEISLVEVENAEYQDTENIDDMNISKQIRNQTGIDFVRMGYKPKEMVFQRLEIDSEQEKAVLLFNYHEQTIRYSMYLNNSDSSYAQKNTDQLIDKYDVLICDEKVTANVYEYDVKGEEGNRYVVEFEFKDAQYQLIGIMEKEEMMKILNNLIFPVENA